MSDRSEASGHEAGHGRVDRGLAGLARVLGLLAEAPAPAEPGEGPLHRPAAGQDPPRPPLAAGGAALQAEAARPGARMLGDLDGPARLALDPRPAGAGVAPVDPDVPEPRGPLGGAVEERRDGGAISRRRRVGLRSEGRPPGLRREVTPPSAGLLGPVVAHPARRRGFDRLA